MPATGGIAGHADARAAVGQALWLITFSLVHSESKQPKYATNAGGIEPATQNTTKRFKSPHGHPRSPRSRALQSQGRQRAGKGQGTVSKHGTYASNGRHHVLAPDFLL